MLDINTRTPCIPLSNITVVPILGAIFNFYFLPGGHARVRTGNLNISQDYLSRTLFGRCVQISLEARKLLFISSSFPHILEALASYMLLHHVSCTLKILAMREEGLSPLRQNRFLQNVGGLRNCAPGVDIDAFHCTLNVDDPLPYVTYLLFDHLHYLILN